MRHHRMTAVAMVLITAVALFMPSSGAQSAPVNWAAYLNGPSHSSYQRDAAAITTANASNLVTAWSFVPPPGPHGLPSGFESSPTVYDGVVYLGAQNGYFYALSETTGQVLWSDDIGTVGSHAEDCAAHGFVSTASVALSPATGEPTVYVAAPNGYLYAFDAASGTVDWRSVIAIPSRTESNYFDWSSPTVYGGFVYVGISSHCDDPLVRAGLLKFDQGTGARLAVFYTVAPEETGASIWSSAGIGPNGQVYVTTGNGPPSNPNIGKSVSIIDLSASLKLKSWWQVPSSQQANDDDDFGGSPTFFEATLPGQTAPSHLVGACNKNGYYYAWPLADLASGPVWQYSLGSALSSNCIAAAAWNGSHLFVGGASGLVAELDPSTGTPMWTTTVSGSVLGSPTLDGSDVLAVPTTGNAQGVVLLNAATGALLGTLNTTQGSEFAQPVFADGYIFAASMRHGMVAYEPPSGAHRS